MENLLAAVEGGVDLQTVLQRLNALESEKAKLEDERETLDRISSRQFDIKHASQEAANFLLRFERRFDNAPIQEKKELLRQVVIGVRVNPETRTALCAITKIPMATQQLEAVINPSEFLNSGHLVGAHRSGGRT